MDGECSECGRITHTVAQDGWYFLCALHGQRIVSAKKVPDDMLTERQLQVALFMAEGYTNGEIAQEIGLSYGYVANCASKVITRLQAGNRRRVIRVLRQWNLP